MEWPPGAFYPPPPPTGICQALENFFCPRVGHFALTDLLRERCTVRVNDLVQEHNRKIPARAGTWIQSPAFYLTIRPL